MEETLIKSLKNLKEDILLSYEENLIDIDKLIENKKIDYIPVLNTISDLLENNEKEDVKSIILNSLSKVFSFSDDFSIQTTKFLLSSVLLDEMFSKQEINYIINSFKKDQELNLNEISTLVSDLFENNENLEEYVISIFASIEDSKKKEILEHLRLLHKIKDQINLPKFNQNNKENFNKLFEILNEISFPPMFKFYNGKFKYINEDINKTDVALFYYNQKNKQVEVISSAITKVSGDPHFEGIQNIIHPFILDLIAKKFNINKNINSQEDLIKTNILNNIPFKLSLLNKKVLNEFNLTFEEAEKLLNESFKEQEIINKKITKDFPETNQIDYKNNIKKDFLYYLKLFQNPKLVLKFQEYKTSEKDINKLLYKYEIEDLYNNFKEIIKKENIQSLNNKEYLKKYLSNCNHHFTIVGNNAILGKGIPDEISISMFLLAHYQNLLDYNRYNNLKIDDKKLQEMINNNVKKINMNQIKVSKKGNKHYLGKITSVVEANKNVDEIFKLFEENIKDLSSIFKSNDKITITRGLSIYLWNYDEPRFEKILEEAKKYDNRSFFDNIHVLLKIIDKKDKIIDKKDKYIKQIENKASEIIKKQKIISIKKEYELLQNNIDLGLENGYEKLIEDSSIKLITLLKDNGLPYQKEYEKLSTICFSEEFKSLKEESISVGNITLKSSMRKD